MIWFLNQSAPLSLTGVLRAYAAVAEISVIGIFAIQGSQTRIRPTLCMEIDRPGER